MSRSSITKLTGVFTVLILFTGGVGAQPTMEEPAWEDDISAQELFDSELDEIQQQENQDKGLTEETEPSVEDSDSMFEPPEYTLENEEVTDQKSDDDYVDVFEDEVDPFESADDIRSGEPDPTDRVFEPDTIREQLMDSPPNVQDLPPELQPEVPEELVDDIEAIDGPEVDPLIEPNQEPTW